MRCAVADEILAHYSDVKNIAEIGSGYGGMARYIARRTGAHVIAIENMPFSVFVSKFLGMLGPRCCETDWCDAFEWMKGVKESIDVAITYLGPRVMPRMKGYVGKF